MVLRRKDNSQREVERSTLDKRAVISSSSSSAREAMGRDRQRRGGEREGHKQIFHGAHISLSCLFVSLLNISSA